MNYQLKTWNFIYWNKGLGVLTLPWIKSFLPFIGVTNELENNIDHWAELYFSARDTYLDSGKIESIFPESRFENEQRNINILNQALNVFGERTNDKALEDLCLWFYCNFLNHNYLRAIRQWNSILTKAVLLSDSSIKKNSRSQLLDPLFLEIEDLIWWQTENFRLQLLEIPLTFPDTLEEDFLSNKTEPAVTSLVNSDSLTSDSNHGIPIGYPGMVYDLIINNLTLDALQVIHLNNYSKEGELWLKSLSSSTSRVDFSIIETIGMSLDEII
jgi:hypothetical protein